MLADIGRAGQNLMHGGDAPSAAVPRSYVSIVEVRRDRLDAEWPARPVAGQRQAIDQPHGFSVDRINLQLLLDFRAALLSGYHAVADRRQRAVPVALARILLHRAQGMLGVLLRLILVEKRHDLTDHVAHRVFAEILRDRDQAHAILGELADVELELELVSEEPREAMNDDDGEHRRLCHGRFDHGLESRPPIVRRRIARLDIFACDFPAFGEALVFDLPTLVGNGQVVVGLPAGRDAQIERGFCKRGDRGHRMICGGRLGHRTGLLSLGPRPEKFVEFLREMRFHDPKFGISDRNEIGPIVGDDDWPVVVRPRARSAPEGRLLIVMQIVEDADICRDGSTQTFSF